MDVVSGGEGWAHAASLRESVGHLFPKPLHVRCNFISSGENYPIFAVWGSLKVTYVYQRCYGNATAIVYRNYEQWTLHSPPQPPSPAPNKLMRTNNSSSYKAYGTEHQICYMRTKASSSLLMGRWSGALQPI